MPETSRHLGPWALAALAAVLVVGCKQSEGDRCEISSDCSSGLICDNPTQTNGVRGSTNPRPVQDAAITSPAEAGVVADSSPDQAPDVSADATGLDVPSPDAAASDAAEDSPADSAAD